MQGRIQIYGLNFAAVSLVTFYLDWLTIEYAALGDYNKIIL